MLRSGGLLLFLPLLAALCPLFPAQSQQAAEAGVITIESDLQSADNSTGVITASGNVRLVHADRGLVATSRQPRDLAELKACGIAVEQTQPDWVLNAGAYRAVDKD